MGAQHHGEGSREVLWEHCWYCWEHCWGSQALRLCCSCISAYDGLSHDLIELCGNERAGARRRSIVLGTVAARTVVIDLGVPGEAPSTAVPFFGIVYLGGVVLTATSASVVVRAAEPAFVGAAFDASNKSTCAGRLGRA